MKLLSRTGAITLSMLISTAPLFSQPDQYFTGIVLNKTRGRNGAANLALALADPVLASQYTKIQEAPVQAPDYGYDAAHGAYFTVAKDTRLYYETYGKGEPILLLHGGVYGYIDEFSALIERLSKRYQVICLATRGHVKSDIGHEPYSYDQRASDAKKLLDYLHIRKARVIGFSDGGFATYRFAANFSAMTKKAVVIGAGNRPRGTKETTLYHADSLMKYAGDYFKKRVAAMPEPSRWEESLQMINRLYNTDGVSAETFSRIKCPVLLIAGEQDALNPPATLRFAKAHIAQARLDLIGGCNHVVLDCQPEAVISSIEKFIE